MIHIKYQDTRPCGLSLEDFSCFPNMGLFKTCETLTGPFYHPEHNSNLLEVD